jgi:hypothetical protein
LYKTTNYTAEAFAAKVSFVCKCDVLIEQPNLLISTSYVDLADLDLDVIIPTSPDVIEELLGSVELTWETPNRREDGTGLAIAEIKEYIIAISTGIDEEPYTWISTTGVSHLVENLHLGRHYFSIATTTVDGITGSFSSKIFVDII